VFEFLTGSHLPSDYGYDQTDNLLGIDAAFENLFEVSLLPRFDNSGDFQDSVPIKNITGISVPSIGIAFKRHHKTKRNYIDQDSLKYFSTVTLSWMEDTNFSVAKFHEIWRKNYYDIDEDRWVSGTKDKFINIRLKVRTTTGGDYLKGGGGSSKGNAWIIDLEGVSLPSDLPKYAFEYSKADILTHSGLSYNVKKISQEFSDSGSLSTDIGNRRNV